MTDIEGADESRKAPRILFIADRLTLERKMLKAEMHPFFAGLTGSGEKEGWMAAAGNATRSGLGLNANGWMSYLGNPLVSYLTGPALEAGESSYIDRNSKELTKFSDDVLLARMNVALGLSMPAVCIEAKDALNSYKFEKSHIPANGEFYIQHPVRKNHYILASEFSAKFIAEKHAAFQKLAAALGAKSVTLKHVITSQTKSLFGAKVPIEEIGAVVGIKVKVDKSGNITEFSSSTYGRPSRAPFIPEDLRDWVQSDTELERMAFSRLEANALSSRISISTLSKQGLVADLVAKVADKETAASYGKSAVTTAVWEFDVEYHDLN
ncbi:hypothetical protein [Stenotrophomonas lactitubi]|uniref:hypothetical protein n=1 Tax=Stenotrophomonas lactitubi TaxID=2045214 RepID=UPI00334297EE